MRYASVCDGIGAAHVAWQPLGWECAWTSEIEPFPAAVVDHHWRLKNLGDMTKLTEEMLRDAGDIQLLVGGTPCQSFSVAGLRKGLDDPRGNLALRFVQLVGVLRPEWVVWENVPGVLSSGNGRDFGTFLGALAELGYGFAYRVLDAQWFGVAQRRRRVFVVANARDWRRAAAVLFERESLFGNPPTRGETWKGAAEGVGESAPTVSSKWAKGTGGFSGAEHYNLTAMPISFKENMSTPSWGVDRAETLQAANGRAVAFKPSHYTRGKDGQPSEVTPPLSADADKGDQDTVVAAPFVKSKRAQSTTDDERWVPGEVAPTFNCFDQGDTRATTVVAQAFTHSGYSNKPAWMTGDRTDCLPASGHGDTSHQGIGVMHPLAVRTAQTSANGHGVANDVCHTLDQVQGQAVAIGLQDTSGTLRSNTRNNSDPRTEAAMHVMHGMAVRRLTPRECERLQGFPDGYTDVTYRNKPAADGPRYKALGNSMAVPVMAWIGRRIADLEAMSAEPEQQAAKQGCADADGSGKEITNGR